MLYFQVSFYKGFCYWLHLREARHFIEMVSAWLSRLRWCLQDCVSRNVRPSTLYRTGWGMSYPHPEPWKCVLFSRGIQPLGAAAWAPPHSSPDSRAPCEHVAGLGLAHVHPHATPSAPFHPKRLCVYQTDLTLSASQKPRSQFLFHVDRELVNTSGWSPEHIGKQSCSNQQETHPLSTCQPTAASLLSLRQVYVRLLSPVITQEAEQ